VSLACPITSDVLINANRSQESLAPKVHHVANKTQERHYVRSSGTNVLVLEQTHDKVKSLLIVLHMHENELELISLQNIF